MFPARHARLFEYVHPVFWPWLWLQLWALGRWQRETGRDLLITVTRHGTIAITHVSDAPAPDSLYRYAPPAIPAWDRPALASGLPPEFSDEDCPLNAFLIGAFTARACARAAAPFDTS